jgi:hypothetical protein
MEKRMTESFRYTEEESKILKNFADIHTGMVIYPDKFMVVNGLDKSLVGIYKFEKAYTYQSYGIYDLKEFLSGVNLYNSELTVKDKYISISNEKQGISTKYRNTPIDILPEVKDLTEKIKDLDFQIQFKLSAEKFAILRKVIQVYGVERLYFKSIDEKTIKVVAAKKMAADNFDPEMQENSTVLILSGDDVISSTLDESTVLYIKTDEFKCIDGDYIVKISNKGISNWHNLNIPNLQYFIGVADIKND